MQKVIPLTIYCVILAVSTHAQTQTFQYQERTEPFANPLKGWVIWGEDFVPNPPQPLTLFFSYRSWRELEPVEGQYDFESWENEVWQPWIDSGKKVIFRVYLDYPGRQSGVPQWLIDAGVTLTPYDEYGGGLSPDYENPLLLERIKLLIQALGERYDNDPRVAFLDVGILGHWGEWHTYPRGELFASMRTQREVLNQFVESFKNKKMMLRYPTERSAQQPFGYRDDCFLTDTEGPEDWKFFSQFRIAGAQDVWQSQPIGGEFCGGGQGALTGTLEQGEDCIRLIREGHFSHLGPAGGSITARNADHQETLDDMLNAMGYRFVIREATLPIKVDVRETLEYTMTVENTGSAPFYYPWGFNTTLIGAVSGNPQGETISIPSPVSDVDVRTWLPGKHTVKVSINLQNIVPPDTAGTFELFVSIQNPMNGNEVARFANLEDQKHDEDSEKMALGTIEFISEAKTEDWKEHE